ncbi:flagellar basal body-associated FliL family protein [Flexibacterium corallicola]|uniref:flagellar basal body-associated FliL family protein n=1 Tax=Flexibacterium corallicola TaxID=3037259 RepID=UPI00286EB64F|nr:flagellar basal body-associated FliL family protein [Pseudovibrio sp. M1P-2-3]
MKLGSALPPSGSAFLPLIGILFLLTLVSAGAGFIFGNTLVEKVHLQIVEDRKSEAQEGAVNPVYASGSQIIALKPIVTNLLSSSQTWIRIETSIILADSVLGYDENSVLVKEIEQDLLIYARTLGPRQLEGSRGLLRLRDDLNERAKIRGGDSVRELIIESVVIQ